MEPYCFQGYWCIAGKMTGYCVFECKQNPPPPTKGGRSGNFRGSTKSKVREMSWTVQKKTIYPPHPGGWGEFFFAFKDTISRHFAGYASVALETIWLHEPRDVIFLGTLMTLLCLSRYSGMGEVLFTHADCRRMWPRPFWGVAEAGETKDRLKPIPTYLQLPIQTQSLAYKGQAETFYSFIAAPEWARETAANESRWRKQARWRKIATL